MRNASRVAAIVLSAGFASGPLIAGLVADHAPRPTVLVFELEAVALVVVAACLWADRGLRSIDAYHRSRPEVVGTVAGVPPVVRMLPVDSRRVALLTATWVFVACGITCAVYRAGA